MPTTLYSSLQRWRSSPRHRRTSSTNDSADFPTTSTSSSFSSSTSLPSTTATDSISFDPTFSPPRAPAKVRVVEMEKGNPRVSQPAAFQSRLEGSLEVAYDDAITGEQETYATRIASTDDDRQAEWMDIRSRDEANRKTFTRSTSEQTILAPYSPSTPQSPTRHPLSRTPPRSLSRSRSRTRQRSATISISSTPSSPSSHFWSRRHSLPSPPSVPSPSRSSNGPLSSLGNRISTCFDSNGHRVLVSRRRNSDAPPPQYAMKRTEVFGFGDDDSDVEEEPWCETVDRKEIVEKVETRDCLPYGKSRAMRSQDSFFTLSTQEEWNDEDVKLRPFPSSTSSSDGSIVSNVIHSQHDRPQLHALVIPTSAFEIRAPSSDSCRSPETIASLSPTSIRRTPQPINTFTPPPPLIPSPASTSFSNLYTSSGLRDGSIRRRSAILLRAGSQSKPSSRLSRSMSLSTPPMQASAPRRRPISCDVSPLSTFRPLEDSVAGSISSPSIMTPPLSPSVSYASSSTGCSSDLMIDATDSVTSSPSVETHSITASPIRRRSLVSSDLPPKPASSFGRTSLLVVDDVDPKHSIGLGLENIQPILSFGTPHLRQTSSPPVTLNRYRNRHQRSYSEGYPLGLSRSTIIETSTIGFDDGQLVQAFHEMKLAVANPDLPRIPPKSPLRSLDTKTSPSRSTLTPPSSHSVIGIAH